MSKKILLPEKQVLYLYSSGKTALEISKIFGVSITPVLRILKECNVDVRKVTSPQYCFIKKDLFKAYNKFKSITKTAAHFNCSNKVIKRLIKKYNIEQLIQRGQRKYTLNIDFFNSLGAEQLYWLGFIAADGWIQSNKKGTHALNVELSNVDYSHLCKFKKAIGSNSPIKVRVKTLNNKKYKMCYVNFCSKQLIESLEKLNIVPNKSFTFKIPEAVKNNSHVNHFIRGYIDGDGCYYLDGKIIKISVAGNKNCLVELHNIVRNNISISTNSKFIYNKKNINVLQYNKKKQVKEVIRWLYKNSNESIRLDRKFNKIKHLL